LIFTIGLPIIMVILIYNLLKNRWIREKRKNETTARGSQAVVPMRGV
jgi:hypothetical protein